MSKTENFGKHLFSILSNILIQEENPNSPKEKPDISEKNLRSAAENLKYEDSKDGISRSVLMLSYAYGPVFKKSFNEVHYILMRAKGNPMVYVRCFAEFLPENYSSLKFLIVCSFISEIFLFLSQGCKKHRRSSYVQRTTEALKDVFQCIFEKDFPQNGWTDIQNKASKIAKGFPILKLFIYKDLQFMKKFLTASEAAEKSINKKSDDENEVQEAEVEMAAAAPQEIESVNIPYDPSSQVLVNIPVSIQTTDATHLVYSENLMCPLYTVFPVTFGTVNEDEQLSYLLQFEGYQTEAVTFENEPSGMEANFLVVETAEPSNIDSRDQENLTARNSEDGIEPSSITDLLVIESEASKHCAVDNAIPSEEYDEEQFLIIFSSGSEDESGPSETDENTVKESERSIADHTVISEQESIDTGVHDCISETLSKENDPKNESFSKEENANNPESETFSKEEDSYGDTSTESATFSTEANISDTENEQFLTEENVNNSENTTFSNENVKESENREFSKETLASESAVNV